ncbi:protein FADD [Osmerus mordax]|uniref:protein FADD n=1 Tax=Osmerus mordax TaxID=8014 RepID=UPI00350F578F
MTEFFSVLLKISEDLRDDNLEKMKFLCPQLGKKRLEKVDSGIKLFQELMQRQLLGPNNTEQLKLLLNKIRREDLAETLNNFESQCPGPQTNLPDKTEQAKLKAARKVIMAQLGRKWRMLGRRLGLTEAMLDSVVTKHRDVLEDQVAGMLCVWEKSQGAEARADDLVRALRSCDLNLTADLVVKELEKLQGE